MRNFRILGVLLASVLLAACSGTSNSEKAEAAPNSSALQSEAAQDAQMPGNKSLAPGQATPVTIPEGKVLVVRLDQTLGSKISHSGDTFTASVSQPLSISNSVVVPVGARTSGVVTAAQPLGHFKGAAVLSLRLNSLTVNGKNYDIQTATVTRSIKGKGKRSAVAIGGGTGLGALVGGLAGGGKGAAIGAAAGAGAGTAGAAFTGNKDVVLPVETAVSFRLTQPVQLP